MDNHVLFYDIAKFEKIFEVLVHITCSIEMISVYLCDLVMN